MTDLAKPEVPVQEPLVEDGANVEKKTRKWPRRALGALAAVGVGLLAAKGSNLMFRNNNMDDFEALRQFTSAAGQEDRCEMEQALNAQDKMYHHFEAQGGVPEDQLPLVTGFVGIEDHEAQAVLESELFQMPMDCEQPTASSNEATQGIVMVTAAASLAVGAAGGALLRGRRQ